MELVESYKILGAVAAAVLWTAILIILHYWPRQRHWSISAHAAASRHAFLTMAIARTASTPLFFLFMTGWFVPYFDMPKWFLITATVMTSCDLVSAWTPDNQNWGRLHKTMAYTVAALMMPITAGVVFAPLVSGVGRGVALLSVSYMLFAWYLFIFVKKSHGYYLYFQGVCIAVFHLSLLAAVFL